MLWLTCFLSKVSDERFLTMTRRLSLLLLIAGSLSAQVTFDRLVNAGKEPQNWLTYSGNMMSQRYSPLDQVTPQNVKNLELKWVYQTRSLEKFEATPLVVDGIMYTVQAPNDVVALDPVTGRVFWTYSYAPSPVSRPCCGRVNRGVAVAGDTLFMGTIDAHLIAVDAKNGRRLWNTTVAKPEDRLRHHACPAGGQGQGDRRRCGRRVRYSRLHRRLRCQDRQGRLALLYHPWPR